jgi:hypothetical protein
MLLLFSVAANNIADNNQLTHKYSLVKKEIVVVK